jgi:hypothetical protein
MVVHKWKTEFGWLNGADAEKSYQEYLSLGGTNGCTPQTMVDFAMNNPQAELAKIIDRNDAHAANQWRKQQARTIMANFIDVKVEMEYDDSEMEPTVVNVTKSIYNVDENGPYKPRAIVVQQPDEMARLTDRAWEYLRDWLHSYEVVQDPDIIAIRQYIQSKMP